MMPCNSSKTTCFQYPTRLFFLIEFFVALREEDVGTANVS